MKTSPAISIVVPVHNTEPYLERMMETVRRQTIWPEIEVILVENGSTDASLAKCRELADRFPGQVRCLVSEKKGPSEARNAGIEVADGDCLMFLDSDDTIEPEMCESLLRLKDEHQADSAICNFILDYGDGTTKHYFPDTGKVTLLTPEQCAYNTIMEKITSQPGVRIFNRSFFDKRRFPEGIFYEDHDAIYRWVSEMNRIVYIDAPLYHYSVRSGSTTMSTNGSPKKIIDHFRADRNRLPFVQNETRFSAAQKKAAIRHIVRELLINLKNYIHLRPNCSEWYNDPQLQQLFASFLSATESFSACTIGFHAATRRMMIKRFPQCYFRKYNSI